MSTPALPLPDDVPTLLETRCLTAADGTVHLVVSGEIDLSTVGVLEAAVEQASLPPPVVVVVDLTRVTFACVAGVGVLTAARAAAVARGAEVVLLTRPGFLRRLLHLVDELGSRDG